MRQIINQTKTPIYENGRLVKYRIDTDTIEVPDPTPRPAPAPVRTLRTNAPTCTHCHQAQTACRCTTTQPHAQAQDVEDWMPRSILYPQGKETPAAAMSTEMRAMKTAQAQWETVFHKCLHHMRYIGHSDDLRGCSTQQLLSVFARLERGEVIDGVRDEVLEAWRPTSILGARRP